MHITALELLVCCLCTFRLSLLFSKEYGPAGMFEKLRRAPPRKSATHEWLSCLFCFSMTASAFVCGCLWLSGRRDLHYAEWFILWCSFSAGAIVLNQLFTPGKL